MIKINRQIFIKYSLIFIFVAIILYIISAMYLYYSYKNVFNSKSYIGGVDVSGLNIEQATNRVNSELDNTLITLTSDKNTELNGKASEFGLSIDSESLIEPLKKQSLQRALLLFWADRNINYQLFINKELLSSKLYSANLPDGLNKPISARYDIDQNNNIIVINEKSGFGFDEDIVSNRLLENFSKKISEYSTSMELSIINPRLSSKLLSENVSQVESLKKLNFILKDSQISYTIPFDQIVKYLSLDYSNKIYLPEENSQYIIENIATTKINSNPINSATYVYSDGTTKSLIEGINGRKVSKTKELSQELRNSIINYQDLNATIDFEETKYTNTDINISLDKKIYRYKVDTWGEIGSNINEFRINAAETLNSALGWSRAGIAFVENNETYDFVLVLSNPQELINKFPGTCDSTYSCQVANYVIINSYRWRTATSVWNKSIREYQHLVINHETGHWLGLGHYSCTKPGDPAPVMQQQSINLGFCTFNEWPLDYEISKI